MKDLITIILPCYKAEECLANIISDVRKQTYVNWELLIVSNGDNQESQLKIAKRFADKDDRIKVLTIVNKGGVSLARNFGIKEAKGEWIVFIDADDRICTDHLKRFADAIDEDEEKPDILVGGFVLDQSRENFRCEVRIPKGHTKKELVYDAAETILSAPWNKIYRKAFACQYSFNTEYSMREDAVFNMTLMTNTNKIKTIPMTGYIYALGDFGNASSRYHSTYEKSLIEFYALIKKAQRQCGISEDELQERDRKLFFIQSYDVVRNMFKKGSTMSLCQQHRDIERFCFSNSLSKETLKIHHFSEQSILMKVWWVCLKLRSSWITVMVFRLQYWLKKHFMALFLKIWPLLSRKR